MQGRSRPDELLDLRPGDSASATWTLACTETAGPGGVDVKGPYIQGRPGERFICLSWGTFDALGGFTMFRRTFRLSRPLSDSEQVDRAEAEAGRFSRLAVVRPQPA